MRIALLHYTKPPVIGGVERVIADQAHALRELEHEVVVVAREDMLELQKSMECRRVVGSPHPMEGRRVVGSPFLNPSREIKKHRHGLPHWHQDGAFCFVTWRLADSLPADLVRSWEIDRKTWEEAHPKPWTTEVAKQFQDRFGDRLEEWLDQGVGRCLLAEPRCATEVEKALHFFDGQRYQLHSYVVMPNHVHVLVRFFDEFPIQKVVQNWKERSAKAINAALGQTGTVWMSGYFDRLIRSEEHLAFASQYIDSNPTRANLKMGFATWKADDSSALLTIRNADDSSALHTTDDSSALPPAAIIAHNVFTMPFDLAWTAELHALAAAHPEIRWINWIHDVAAVNPHYAHLDWDSEDLKRLSLPPPNTVNVTVSEVRQQDYARATGLDPAQIHVIPNGVDPVRVLGLTQRIAAEADAGGWWQSDVILVHPARILRRKNLEMAIHVTAHLKSQGLAPRYLITGAPDPHQADGTAYFKELQKLIQTLDLPAEVTFLAAEGEPLTDDDIRSLYALGDALFFPSTGEGFGLPLLEAAIHRLPIWCSDLPVHREVLGTAAHFFPADGDPAVLAASLRDWIATDRDLQLRKRIWRKASWRQLCKERLEPLLTIGIEKT